MANYQSKLDRLITSLQDRVGLARIIPGSKSYQLAQSIAYEQYQTDLILEQDAVDNSPILSTGTALENIANNFFGIERRSEIRTAITDKMEIIKFYVNSGTFGDINNGNDIIIPEGTLLEGTIGINMLVRLATTSQITLNKLDSEKYISAELVQGPVDAIPKGTITKHYFSNYTQANGGSLLVTNDNIMATGRPAESDDNYRYRFFNGLRAFAKTNTAGIFEAASGVPGVSYVLIDPHHNGGGTFAVYVQSIQPITPDSLIDEVRTEIEDSLGPWINVEVLKPNYIGLSIDATLTMKDSTQYIGNTGFINSIQNNLSSYINNFNNTIFYLSDIERVLESYSQDISSVTINSIKQYVGVERFRIESELDLTVDKSIIISNIEKLIIESIANAITIRIA